MKRALALLLVVSAISGFAQTAARAYPACFRRAGREDNLSSTAPTGTDCPLARRRREPQVTQSKSLDRFGVLGPVSAFGRAADTANKG